MIRVALRGVREHVVRFGLSILAVTIGVAFVVGTLAFRSMLAGTFDAIIETTVNADVYVRGDRAVAADLGSQPGPPADASLAPDRTPVAISLAEQVADVPGVRRAVPEVSGPAVLLGADGTAVVTSGPPSIAFAIDPEYPTATLLDGAWPGPGQVALERGAARASGLATGDTTRLVLGEAPRTVTVSGTFALDAATAGAVLVGLDAATARQVFAPEGTVGQISVYAADGVAEDTLAARVADALPASAEAQAVTGSAVRAEARAQVQEVLGFLQTFLLVFAAIALVVGAFIIANAFAMAVRERQRENALLRAVGASPAQVFGVVLAQAFAVGLVGAALGAGRGRCWCARSARCSPASGTRSPATSRCRPGRWSRRSRWGRRCAWWLRRSRPGGRRWSRRCRRCTTTSPRSAAPWPARWAAPWWRGPAAGCWCWPRASARRWTTA